MVGEWRGLVVRRKDLGHGVCCKNSGLIHHQPPSTAVCLLQRLDRMPRLYSFKHENPIWGVNHRGQPSTASRDGRGVSGSEVTVILEQRRENLPNSSKFDMCGVGSACVM